MADTSSVHVLLVVDQSGSMIGDGKMQSVNTALAEIHPHLVDLSERRSLIVDIITFADSAKLHQTMSLPDQGENRPTPIAAVERGLTETGQALALVGDRISACGSSHAVVALVSDGRATDTANPTAATAIAQLTQASGTRIEFIALALGRDADHDTIEALVTNSTGICHNAMELVGRTRKTVARLVREDHDAR